VADTLFIYNAEAETDVSLTFCSLTPEMKKIANGQVTKKLFDDLLQATFQLRSDLVPSRYEERREVIESCVAPANLVAYILAHSEINEQQLADRVLWNEGAYKALQEIYKKGVTKATQNKITEEGNVVIISLGIVTYDPDDNVGIGNEKYRSLTVNLVKDDQTHYKRYRSIGLQASKSALSSMATMLNAPASN